MRFYKLFFCLLSQSTLQLLEWNVKEGKRYICVGTGGFHEASGNDSARGRVLIYNLKLHNEKPEVIDCIPGRGYSLVLSDTYHRVNTSNGR